MSSTSFSWTLGALFMLVLGCDGGAADRIDNRLDCRQICDRYQDCASSDYDVDQCKEDCRDSANADNDFERKVEHCSDCISNDDSCTETAFKCATDCVGIVP